MKPIAGFVVLLVLAPIVLVALATPLPLDELLAFGVVGSFAGWLLNRMRDD